MNRKSSATTVIGPAMMTAGPAFAASAALAFGLLGSNAPIPVDASPAWLAVIPLLAVVLAAGAVLGGIPIVIGVKMMVRLGKANDVARLPVVWALAGAAMAGGWAVFVPAAPALSPLAFTLSMTGAASGLAAGAAMSGRW